MSNIQLDNISYDYTVQQNNFTALQDVSLEIKEGEFVSIIGPSGCGKSTLLSLLVGLQAPSAGCILLDGEPLQGTGKERGTVFQHYSLFPWMSAKKNIIFGIQQVNPKLGKKAMSNLADEYLELVELKDAAHKYPGQLSGGMQQRVAIARAFAMDPKILLMDEPFGALDTKNRVALQEVLLQLRDSGKERKTVVFITHDVDEAILLSDKIIVMNSKPGRIAAEVQVPFERPRNRASLVGSPRYMELRNNLVSRFYDDLIERIGGDEVVL
ncbi:MAG TPA: ABC transporter ATP-binding protein [Bacillota bacterium]|nr:ABC transporter ATP-binding protein [Bacillota bacterium]